MVPEIFDATMVNLEKAIEKTAKAQEVIAHNIANANTPGYIPQKFDEVLNKAVQKEDQKKVGLEEEMADMAKNNIKHSALTKILMGKLQTLRSVVTQGRR